MDEKSRSFLKYAAMAAVMAWAGASLYSGLVEEGDPVQQAYITGDRFFANADYERALAEYEKALARNPEAPYLVRAKARALMQLGRSEEALAWFTRALQLQPFFGVTYASRGTLYDRMGRYDLAISDYQQALQLDDAIGEDASVLTLFLRNQQDNPATLRERLAHLQTQFAKPVEDAASSGGIHDVGTGTDSAPTLPETPLPLQ